MNLWCDALPSQAASAAMACFGVLAMLTAWWLDRRFGEPSNRLHPVAWLGRVLQPIGAYLEGRSPAIAFLGGALAWCVIAALLVWAAASAQCVLLVWATQASPSWWLAPAAMVCGALLKPCFAWRMLHDEVRAVEDALVLSLDAGRAQVARIVSRDVRLLDADEVRETAIETLAENLNDSVVAPLFWFAVAGLAGAVLYRFANTCDAMWGYRGRFEWMGKWAARADDVLSWIPARITAALLAPSWLFGQYRRLRAEAGRTPSPNGGWPMGAMALQLGVRLRKPSVYTLNADAPSPAREHMIGALDRAHLAALRALGLCIVLAVLLAVGRIQLPFLG